MLELTSRPAPPLLLTHCSGLPAIQDFVDKHSQQFKGALTIIERAGAYPK
jgi:hypothetical protein